MSTSSAMSGIQNLVMSGGMVNVVGGSQTNNTTVFNFIGTSDAGNAVAVLANQQAATTAAPCGSVYGALSASRKRSLPRVSRLFTGREDVLRELAKILDPTKTSIILKKQRIFVLYGLGGTGKTQIMAKFVDEFGDEFCGIYYIDGSTLQTIQASFEDIARTTSAGKTVDDALHWLAQERKDWLLLIDNADDPQINLCPFLPDCKHGNVIITSRNPECRTYAPESNWNVSGMKHDDAIELLLKWAMVEHSTGNYNLGSSICQELGYLALAIVQADAYIAHSCSIGDYLEIYCEDRITLLQKHSVQKGDDYQWTVYTTWEMSLKKLSPTAAMLLRLCGFMHYDGISKAIFQNAATAGDDREAFQEGNDFMRNFQFENRQWSNIKFLECIKELASYSLISIDAANQVYSIHPLVHTWARYRTSPVEQNETQNCVLQILALAITYDYSAESFAFRRSLLPHIDEAYKNILEPDIAEKLQTVYIEAERWKTTEELQKRVVEIRIRLLGIEHLDTLRSMGDLAFTYRKQGRWKDAENLQVQVMEARRRLLDVEHPDMLRSMGDLASTYRYQCRWKDAEKLEVQVMETRTRLLGDENPDTLTSMANLASTYWDQGRWEDAEKLEVQVMGTRTRLLGDEHPYTLTSMANLASTYRDQGRWEDAEKLEVQVMDASTRLLGDEHPDTLTSIANLAATYWNQGRWKDAEKLGVQVMDARTRLLGDEHPYTLTSMANLASTYWNQGRWKDAEKLQVQVMDAVRRLLGGERPDTLTSMANLAATYRKQGRWKDAKKLEVQVVEARRRLLGDEHPDTLAAIALLQEYHGEMSLERGYES